MSSLRILAIVLILGGVGALAWGGFSYTKTTHQAKVGPFEFGMKEKKTVNVPLWAGVAAIVAGAALLVVPKPA